MPNAISMGYSTHFALSEARQASIDALKSINFNKPEEVEAVRQRIQHMGPLDKFSDWAFHDGAKEFALKLIAAKAVADQHVVWAARVGEPEDVIVALEKARYSLHEKIVNSLTQQGVAEVLAKTVGASEHHVHFEPCTNNGELDKVLGEIVLPHNVAVRLLNKYGGGSGIAQQYCDLAKSDEIMGRVKATLYENAASMWLYLGKKEAAETAWQSASDAYMEHAEELSRAAGFKPSFDDLLTTLAAARRSEADAATALRHAKALDTTGKNAEHYRKIIDALMNRDSSVEFVRHEEFIRHDSMQEESDDDSESDIDIQDDPAYPRIP